MLDATPSAICPSRPACAPDIVKVCACGRRYTLAQFEALPAPGAGSLMDDGDGGWLWLANCACRSTLALPVTR